MTVKATARWGTACHMADYRGRERREVHWVRATLRCGLLRCRYGDRQGRLCLVLEEKRKRGEKEPEGEEFWRSIICETGYF